MHKVMTRTRRHPGSRPPVRHDTRRPGGTPARTTPGDAATSRAPLAHPARTASSDDGPPTAPQTTPSRTTARPGATAATARPTKPSAKPPRTALDSGPAPATAPPASALRQAVPQPRPTDHFADLLLAVLSGQRPVHSMLRHTAGRAYDDLAWLAERGPLRTTRGMRPVVRDIGYFVPRPGAIEAFARIGAGDQLRAMAFRLEHGPDNRWRCTAVELGCPRMPGTDDD